MSYITEKEPIISYHGTASNFFEFKAAIKQDYGKGIYFTSNLEGAKKYAQIHSTKKQEEPSLLDIIYFGNYAGVRRDLFTDHLAKKLNCKYGLINRTVDYIRYNGPQSKEQLMELAKLGKNPECFDSCARDLADLSDDQLSIVVDYFKGKTIDIKKQSNLDEKIRVLKVELTGNCVSWEQTYKEAGLPPLSQEQLLKILSYRCHTKINPDDKEQFVRKTASLLSTHLKHDDVRTALKENIREYRKDVVKWLDTYDKEDENLSAFLTKQAALQPELDELAKKAESLLRNYIENSPIQEYCNMPNFCKENNIDVVFGKEDYSDATYYVVKNPKSIRVIEYMSEETNWRWKPAPQRPEPRMTPEENLYRHFSMSKKTYR